MSLTTPPNFSAYLRTQCPPSSFDDRSLFHPFYFRLTAYLTQLAPKAPNNTSYNDLRHLFAEVIENTYTWLPNFETIDAGIEVFLPIDPGETVEPYVDPLERQMWDYISSKQAESDSGTVVNSIINRYAAESIEDEAFASPNLSLFVIGRYYSMYFGSMRQWRLPSLTAQVHHYPLFPKPGPGFTAMNLLPAAAADAMTQAVSSLATAWIKTGTWAGLAVVNSKFSRLCVLDGEYLGGSRLHLKGDVINIALEVPQQVQSQFPNATVDRTTLFEAKPIEAYRLFCHDLLETHGTSPCPIIDLGIGHFGLDHGAVKALWDIINITVNALGRLSLGQPPEQLPAPSPMFRAFADSLLLQSQPLVTIRSQHRDRESVNDRTSVTERRDRHQGSVRRRFATFASSLKRGRSPLLVPHTLGTSERKDVPSLDDSNATLSIREWAQTVGKARYSDFLGVIHTTTKPTAERQVMVRFVCTDDMDRLLRLRSGERLERENHSSQSRLGSWFCAA